MGMYTELNIGVKVVSNPRVIQKLNYMIKHNVEDVDINHPLFTNETRWNYMLVCDSYYFDGQTDSKLIRDDLYEDYPMYFLNVRCNLKNYDDEIELFMDWLCPYIETEGFLGYMRYEEDENPRLIYKDNGEIVYKSILHDRTVKEKWRNGDYYKLSGKNSKVIIQDTVSE